MIAPLVDIPDWAEPFSDPRWDDRLGGPVKNLAAAGQPGVKSFGDVFPIYVSRNVLASRRVFEAAREPKQLWIVPDAYHAKCRESAGLEYDTRVAGFSNRDVGAICLKGTTLAPRLGIRRVAATLAFMGIALAAILLYLGIVTPTKPAGRPRP